MKTILPTMTVLALLVGISGCLFPVRDGRGDPRGDRYYSSPGVVVEPPAYRWHWWGLPHYDVEHRYVVDDRPVVVEHHHYYPFYDRAHPPLRQINERRGQQEDRGRNRERPDDRGHDRD